MGIETDLLRMLEPAVRPGGLPSAASVRRAPIEGQSFEELLAAARGGDDDHDNQGESTIAGQRIHKPDPLGELAGLDRVENASLQRLIGTPGSATQGRSQPDE